MEMITNEKINFNSLEEKVYKDMMKLGRETIQEQLRFLDKLIKDFRDKEVFKCKDMQPTTMFAMAKLIEMATTEQNKVALYLFNNIKIQ